MLDLRLPVGLFFAGLGLILLVVGIGWPETHAPLTESNVNLAGGLMMFVFGGVMLWLARRSF